MSRRDTALVLLLLDTGLCLSELAGMTTDAINIRERTATVRGRATGSASSPSA